MEGSPPPDTVNRRQLLALAAGLAATVAACCTTTPVNAAPRAVASAPLLCRDAWRAQPALPGGRPHTISRMTLHHTEVVLGDNRNAPSRLRQHQRFHQNARGWIDVAYHVGVDRNGNIYELRDYNLAGDTATEYDPAGHFLVLCEGDFDHERVSEAQLHSAALVFAWATQHFNIGSDTLAGHSRYASTTTCPGANLDTYLTSGELKRRIDELATSTVDLYPFCGQQASAAVAAIEAGAMN